MKVVITFRNCVINTMNDYRRHDLSVADLPNGAGTTLGTIFTLTQGQLFARVTFDKADSPPSEADAIFALLSTLNEIQRHSLRKLSLQHILLCWKELPLFWLRKTLGKYSDTIGEYFFGGATDE
jgi:hypothetical protein